MHASEHPYVVGRGDVEELDVLGPTVEILTPAGADDGAPCLIRGTIPPGGFVPLHSHPDPETFVVLAGAVEGLIQWRPEPRWTRIAAGDILHVPGGAPHGWRNDSAEPVVNLIVTTARIAQFFRDVGRPAGDGLAGPPSLEELEAFDAVAKRYGYWNAAPEQNAEVGLPAGPGAH